MVGDSGSTDKEGADTERAGSRSGFDEEDIEKIRSGTDSLRARVDRRHESVAESKKKRFAVSFSASVIFLLFVVVISFSMIGTAVTIGQVGGFEVFFDEIDGQQVNIYPAIDESAACENTSVDATPGSSAQALPVLKAEVGQANATEIRLTKDVKTPEITGIPGFRVKLNQTGTIASRPDVSSSDLAFKFTNLQADRIEIQGTGSGRFILDEDYSQPNDGVNPIFSSDGEFQFGGENALIQNGEAVATFVAFGGLNAPNARLEISYPPFVDATKYPEAGATGGQKEDEWITGVQFAGIDNPSRGDLIDGYEDYTQISTNVLNAGQTETITITSGISQFTKGGSGDIYPTVWIDWNQSNTLDPGEQYDIPVCSGNGCSTSDSITVPADAEPGITLMRVTIDDNGHGTNAPDDAAAYDGEYEDYAVKVAPASDLEPLNVKRTSSCPALPDVG